MKSEKLKMKNNGIDGINCKIMRNNFSFITFSFSF